MKNLKMFAIGLVAFAVMTMGVHAADPAEVYYIDADSIKHPYTSIQAAIAAANQESADHDNAAVTVILSGNNITEDYNGNIQVTGNIVLDLGDYKITLGGTTNKNTRFLVTGSLTVTGTEGKATVENLTDSNASMFFVQGENASLTIEKGVTIDNKSTVGGVAGVVLYGATGTNSAKGTTITINGIIKAKDNMALATNGQLKDATDKTAPVITIGDSAKLESEGVAFYQAGYAKTTIGKATITGSTGVSLKAGSVVFNGTTVNADGDADVCKKTSGETNNTGAAVQVEGNIGYKSPAKVTFNGGIYTSENSNAIKACAYEKAAVAEGSKINNGEFTSGDDAKGEPLPNISLEFNSTNNDDNLSWIDDLEGFIVKGTFNNGPVIGDAQIGGTGSNTSMGADVLLSKLAKGVSINSNNGTILVGGGNSNTPSSSGGQKPSDEQKPNTSDTANTPEDSKNPQTGDSIMTYMGLGIASIAVVGLGAKNLKKQTSR